MDSSLWWWFMSICIVASSISIQAHRLSHSVKEKYESTNIKQTSKKSSVDYVSQSQSISSSYLAEITSTIRPSSTIQSLVTKPNSYLYDPNDDDDDDEILLGRVKRESPPFVCKGKISKFCKKEIFSSYFLADGYYPDRQNCRVYHICTSGVDTAAVCAEGTAWDPIQRNCVWENTVECKKGLRRWDQITDIRGGRKD